jgi:hypothetical protein
MTDKFDDDVMDIVDVDSLSLEEIAKSINDMMGGSAMVFAVEQLGSEMFEQLFDTLPVSPMPAVNSANVFNEYTSQWIH